MVPLPAQAASRSPQRSLLGMGVLLLCALALAPVVSLGWFALAAGEGSRFDLGYGGSEQVVNTLALVALVGLLTALLGTATGWLTARCAFPGRRLLRIGQLLPLATPSYLLAATWIDLGSPGLLLVGSGDHRLFLGGADGPRSSHAFARSMVTGWNSSRGLARR